MNLAHGFGAADQLGHGLGQARHRRGRWATRGGADLPGELIAASRHRANQITVDAKRLAKRGDLGLEVVLFDDPVWPDPAHQLVLVEDCAAGVDQDEQRVEGATAERDGCAVDNELAAMGHDREATELHGRKRLALAGHGDDCTVPCQDDSGAPAATPGATT